MLNGVLMEIAEGNLVLKTLLLFWRRYPVWWRWKIVILCCYWKLGDDLMVEGNTRYYIGILCCLLLEIPEGWWSRWLLKYCCDDEHDMKADALMTVVFYYLDARAWWCLFIRLVVITGVVHTGDHCSIMENCSDLIGILIVIYDALIGIVLHCDWYTSVVVSVLVYHYWKIRLLLPVLLKPAFPLCSGRLIYCGYCWLLFQRCSGQYCDVGGRNLVR